MILGLGLGLGYTRGIVYTYSPAPVRARALIGRIKMVGSRLGLGLGLGLGRDYFVQLHIPFPIPRSMQRGRHQGNCQVISAAIEWDPTAKMFGSWRLNPLSSL